MKNKIIKLVLSVILPLLLIGSLGLFALNSAKTWIEAKVSQERVFEKVTFTPHGFKINNIFHLSFDSLSIYAPSGKAQLHDIHLKFSIIHGKTKNIAVYIDSVDLDIKPIKDTTQADSTNQALKFKKLSFPLSWIASINKTNIKLDSNKTYIDNLNLSSEGKQSAKLTIDSIANTMIENSLSLNLTSDWSELMLQSEVNVLSSNQDFILINFENDFSDLRTFLMEFETKINNPTNYMKEIDLPSTIPSLSNLNLSGYLNASIAHNSFDYKIKSSINTGVIDASINYISPSKINLNLDGSNLNSNFDFRLNGKKNEIFDFEGKVSYENKNLFLKTKGKIRNFIINFNDNYYKIPLDLDVKSIIIKNDSIYADVETPATTKVTAKGSLFPNLKINFDGEAGQLEPWALDWCEGECKLLGDRPKITGTFERGMVFINAKVPKPFAYYANPDYLETDIAISGNNLTFDNIIILDGNKEYTGSGQISIDGVNEYIKFNVLSGNEHASFFYDFDSVMTVNAKNIVIDELPLDTLALPIIKNLDGIISGNMDYNYPADKASFNIDWETMFLNTKAFVKSDFGFNKDTIIINNAEIKKKENSLTASAKFIIPDSLTTLYENMEYAKISVNYLDLSLLRSLKLDSNISSGEMRGFLDYRKNKGLDGKVTVKNLILDNVDSNFLFIERLHIDAIGTKAMANAKIHLGELGEWDNELSLVIDDIITTSPSIKGNAVMDHSGVISFDSKVNNYESVQSNIKMEGPWLLPADDGTVIELTRSKIEANITNDLNKGFDGLNGNFISNLLEIKLTNDLSPFPLFIKGDINQGIVNVNNLQLTNSFGDIIKSNVIYDLNKLLLTKLEFSSDLFRVRYNKTQLITLKNFTGNTTIDDFSTNVYVFTPFISYASDDKDIGNIRAKANGEFNYIFPLHQNNDEQLQQDELSGVINISSFDYSQDFELNPYDKKNWIKIFNGLKNYFSNRKSKQAVAKTINNNTPTALDIIVRDESQGKMKAKSDLFSIPFTTDIRVNGTTNDIILNGNINSIGNAYVGMGKSLKLDVNNLTISWNSSQIEDGILNANIGTTLPLCSETNDTEECPVEVNVGGNLSEPELNPIANCGWEASPIEIYSGIVFFNCMTPMDDQSGVLGEGWSMVGDKALGVLINSAISALGAKYIGNTQISWDFFNNNTAMEETDSSYIKVPILLDDKIKGLKFTLGYAKGTGINPRYEDSYELGVDYILPIFNEQDSTEFENMLDPELSASAKIIARTYAEENKSDNNPNNIQFNLGFNYQFKYWDFCFLNIGYCNDDSNKEKKNDNEEDGKSE